MLRDAGPASQFGQVRVPVDVLFGERSFAAIRQSAREWERLLPRARAHPLRGAGHLPIVEAAAQVREILYGEICATDRLTRVR
jgi:pimeloyl-ACP methyl ester carboxylesterase